MPLIAAEFYHAAGVDVDAPEMAWSHKVVLKRRSRGEIVDMDLRKFQVKSLAQCIWNEKWGLFDEPGTGKTLPAQAAILYRAAYGNRVLVNMPPRLLDQFCDALHVGWAGQPFGWHLLRADPRQREALRSTWNSSEWPPILLMSYQMMTKLARPFDAKRVKSKDDPTVRELKTYKEGDWRKELFDRYHKLVGDEAQALKNWSSTISMLTADFVLRDGIGFIPMTGTPIHNEVRDAYGLIRLINPDAYYNFEQFERRHMHYGKGHGGWKTLLCYKNLDEVSDNLYKNASRVLKREAMPWLPKVEIQEVPVTLEKWQLQLYKKMVEERVLELGESVLDLDSEQRLRMACLQSAVTPEKFMPPDAKLGEEAVMEAVDSILDTIGFHTPEVDPRGVPIDPRPGQKSKRKVILVCHFQDSVKKMALRYKDFGAEVIYGGASKKDAQRAEQRFKEDPTCRVLVINSASGGAGFNFQDWCSSIIFIEPTAVPGNFQQAVDRLDRGDQDEQVTVWIVKVLRTAYVTAVRNMQRKAETVVFVNRDRQTLLRDLSGELDEYDYELNRKSAETI